MDFLKHLIGIVTVFLCLSMFGKVRQEPGGTLVDQAQEVML